MQKKATQSREKHYQNVDRAMDYYNGIFDLTDKHHHPDKWPFQNDVQRVEALLDDMEIKHE